MITTKYTVPPTSWIELDPAALENNLRFLRKYIGPQTKISSVVKANAYGHGIIQFVPLAESMGIDHFAVFSSHEAFDVHKIKAKDTRLMIMGWLSDDEVEWAISHQIEFYVFDLARLESAITISRRLRIPAMIHLEVETGMNRTGLNRKEFPKVIRMILDNDKDVKLTGVCTHFAGAESIANYYRVQLQFRTYKRIIKWMASKEVRPEFLHTAGSAAALSFPSSRLDMVRIGIAQYGFWPSKEIYMDYIHSRKEKIDPLQRVISWKSAIMSIKDVQEGEFVSYGTTYLAESNKRIAVIPVGYATGFSRSLSNQGRVLIDGQRVGVIGLVNMNMLIADISHVSNARIGDEVVLIGKQGDMQISVASFSEISNQLNYELLTRLPQNINRIVHPSI
ncbi:MAG: alanine racemase [Bacteroidia bacterium]|nr:alanine racemase [Bacteroidia bacterium]